MGLVLESGTGECHTWRGTRCRGDRCCLVWPCLPHRLAAFTSVSPAALRVRGGVSNARSCRGSEIGNGRRACPAVGSGWISAAALLRPPPLPPLCCALVLMPPCRARCLHDSLPADRAGGLIANDRRGTSRRRGQSCWYACVLQPGATHAYLSLCTYACPRCACTCSHLQVRQCLYPHANTYARACAHVGMPGKWLLTVEAVREMWAFASMHLAESGLPVTCLLGTAVGPEALLRCVCARASVRPCVRVCVRERERERGRGREGGRERCEQCRCVQRKVCAWHQA